MDKSKVACFLAHSVYETQHSNLLFDMYENLC